MLTRRVIRREKTKYTAKLSIVTTHLKKTVTMRAHAIFATDGYASIVLGSVTRAKLAVVQIQIADGCA